MAIPTRIQVGIYIPEKKTTFCPFTKRNQKMHTRHPMLTVRQTRTVAAGTAA